VLGKHAIFFLTTILQHEIQTSKAGLQQWAISNPSTLTPSPTNTTNTSTHSTTYHTTKLKAKKKFKNNKTNKKSKSQTVFPTLLVGFLT